MTEKDRAAEILGLANIVIAYRQVWSEDLALLVRLLFPANLRFDKLYHEIFQHQGDYTWLRVIETSRSETLSKQHGVADGEGSDEGFSEQASKSIANQEQWSKANALGNGRTASDVEG